MQQFRIPIGPHSVAAWRVGSGEKLLVVHGGPGIPCGYVYHAHTRYAEQGLEVVSWDQLGCGDSDRPEDASLWTIPRFVEEVEQVRRHLGWEKFLLLGNSWGGILTIEYCLRYQQHVKALVVGNMGSDMTLISAGFTRVKAALGSDTVRMMALRESAGTTTHPEYLAARTLLMQRHMCRMEEWPKPVLDALAEEGIGRGPFVAMFGMHFFNCSGSLRTWNRTSDLARLKVPVLFTTSEWDYILPDYVRLAHEHLPGSQLVIFENSGHLPFWDAADRYHPVVLEFLRRHP
jgi:proline iminopeptidase